MVTLEDIRQLAGRELLSRAFVLATKRLEEADAETIFALIVKVLEADARGRRHLYWAPMASPGPGWCPTCGLPVVGRKRGAIYCSRRCGATARQRRRRGKKALSEMGALSRLPYLGVSRPGPPYLREGHEDALWQELRPPAPGAGPALRPAPDGGLGWGGQRRHHPDVAGPGGGRGG